MARSPEFERSSTKSKRPTLEDIANASGFSIKTVSYALKGSTEVPVNTRRHIKEWARKLRYEERRERIPVLGISMNTLQDPYYSQIIKSLFPLATRRGYQVDFNNRHRDYEKSAIAEYDRRRVDGIIVLGPREKAQTLENLANPGRPLILIDPPAGLEQTAGLFTVEADHARGTLEAVQELVKRGHRKIAYILSPDKTPADNIKYDAYKEHLKDAGLFDKTLTVQLFPGGDPFYDGYASCRYLFWREDGPPTAVLCSNDFLAVGAMKKITEQGLRIPDDISVVGYGDQDFSGFTVPKLSSVSVRPTEIAQKALDHYERFFHESPDTYTSERTVIPTVFYPRESIGLAKTR